MLEEVANFLREQPSKVGESGDLKGRQTKLHKEEGRRRGRRWGDDFSGGGDMHKI